MRTASQLEEELPSTFKLLVRSSQAEGGCPTISVSLWRIMAWPSLSSSSWKLPRQRVLNSFLRVLCSATMRMVMGSEMIAKGSECTVSRSTSIQQSEPKQKETSPMRKYTQVPLVLSNLRRQERTRPGKRAAVMGSQAQRRQSSGVMEGITSTMGFWKRLIMQLLQEIFSTQCTTTPTKISSASRLPSRLTAIESEVTLSSFMRATVEQMAMMSLTSHCPLNSQQSGTNNSPPPKEITSMSLTCLQTFFWQFLLWLSQMVSEMHTPTPTAPTTLPRMRANREATSGSRQPRTMKSSRQALKMTIALFEISYPTPPQDHALLKSDPRVSTRVVSMIRSRSPHSNGLQNSSGLQLTRYSSCPSEVASWTSLICGDAAQRLLSSTVQLEPLQTRSLWTGALTPPTEVIVHPTAWMVQLLCVLSAQMQSSGMPQSISLRYWQNCWLRTPSTAIGTGPVGARRVMLWALAGREVRRRQAATKMAFMIKYYELSDKVQICSAEDRQSPEAPSSYFCAGLPVLKCSQQYYSCADELFLPVQVHRDRRPERGQVVPPHSVHRPQVQERDGPDDRGGVRVEDLPAEGEVDQAADLGHGGAGGVQVDHALLLPRHHRRGAGLRCHQQGLLQQRDALDRGDAHLRHQREDHCPPRRQQGRPRPQSPGDHRGGAGARRAARHALHRGLRQDRPQR